MSANLPPAVAPAFPAAWQPLVDRAAEAIRAFALDTDAKERFQTDPRLQPYMHRVAQRYIAGRTVEDALRRLASIRARGHKGSVEYMGESCTDEALAMRETEVFLELVKAVDAAGHDCTISFDLSHVGLAIDPELGYRNARRIAAAAAATGREAIISMEGSERADAIYDTYRRLHDEAGLANVGITVPAKRHRTAHDLPRLLEYPGRIRLVKGAFHEGPDISHARNSPELAAAYRGYALTLLRSGHLCAIATHDTAIQHDLAAQLADGACDPARYEFESLDGLGTAQIDGLRAQGFPTREYLVFGEEHFLYVLNRISEEPVRVYQAVLDLLAPAAA
jgi:proline dehydrogenase